MSKVSPNNLLICATRGKVYAVHKKDGTSIWKSHVQGLGIAPLSIFTIDDLVLVAGFGKVVALDILTGEERWRNELAGMGYSPVTTVSLSPSNVLIACSTGKVAGLDRSSGVTLWRFDCPGGGFCMATAIPDVKSPGTHAFVGCRRLIYYLEVASGQCVWKQQISKSTSPFVTLTNYTESTKNASAFTSFNNFPSASR